MTRNGSAGTGLRSDDATATDVAPAFGEAFERAGYVVQPGRRVGQLLPGRPPGVTAHQWSSATRTLLAFVVSPAAEREPVLAVELYDPALLGAAVRRDDRMTDAVLQAAGLGLLRLESSACGLGSYARRLVEYVIDAHAFTTATASTDEILGVISDAPASYRDIIGRLPDGRSGYVNDLGALARAAAVNAYVSGQLADPIIRGLRVTWRDGTAEGWAWLEVRDGLCIVEHTKIWLRQFAGGLDASRLAEDLATAAIGERLKELDSAASRLRDKHELTRDFATLAHRREEMAAYFTFDEISFG